MNPYKIKISQLRAFVTVAERGNFGTAALELGMSQSSVSHAIATLEEELGVILLSRGRRGAHLTSVGERIFVHAKAVLAPLADIVAEANQARGLQGGSVRIVAFRSIATHVLPKVLVRFQTYFPNIKVILQEYEETPEIEQVLRQGKADIGFVQSPYRKDLDTFKLLQDDYVVLLPPDAPWEKKQLTWQELASYPLIISTTKCCSTVFRPYLQRSQVPLKIAYEIREDSTILSMVSQGLGAAILPRLAAEPIPAGIKMCFLPVPLKRVVEVATLKNANHPPAVFAFLDVLKQASNSDWQVAG